MHVGPHLHIAEAEGPKAYEVRTGTKWLTALEGGEVRCWPEYHLFLLDERTGHVTIEGGYGTFSYGWARIGRGEESLHSFLYDLNFDYFMNKAAKQEWRVPDLDATIASMKRGIIEDRRQGWIEKALARRLWVELEHVDTNDARSFVESLYRDSDWYGRLDYSDPVVMVDHPGMRRFWTEVWKPFAEQVLRPHWLQHQKKTPIRPGRALVAA